jgi:hypothetical protein
MGFKSHFFGFDAKNIHSNTTYLSKDLFFCPILAIECVNKLDQACPE